MRRFGVPGFLALLLLGVCFMGAFVTGQSGPGGNADEPPLVPGTREVDHLARAERTWMVVEHETPHRPVLEGPAVDPLNATIASQVFADRGIVEAVLLEQRNDGQGFQVVFNVGAALSSIRFDPPLPLDDGATIATIDAPRLAWSLPEWDNRSAPADETALATHAPVPLPDTNGTSPAVGAGVEQAGQGEGGVDQATNGTGLVLHWRVAFVDRPAADPIFGDRSPAAMRFTWRLEHSGNATFAPGHEHVWRFRYDYDIERQVVRPPLDVAWLRMDGAYLVSGDHRAGLRLAPSYLPTMVDPGNGTIDVPRLAVDVYPSAGGPAPGPEPRGFPPPLILEARASPDLDRAAAFSLTGDLVFHASTLPRSEPGDDGGDDGTEEAPAFRVRPPVWSLLVPLALATLLVLRRFPPGAATNP